MLSFVYFNGSKIKDYRSPGIAGILFDAPTATFHQDNAYTDFPLHGLWKIADDRVDQLRTCSCPRSTRTTTPATRSRPKGGMDHAGRTQPDDWASRSDHSRTASASARSRRVSVERPLVREGPSAPTHDLEVRARASAPPTRSTSAEWPGNGILGIENSPTDFRAQVFRQGNGANRANYFDIHVGDTISEGPRDDQRRRALRPSVGTRARRA